MIEKQNMTDLNNDIDLKRVLNLINDSRKFIILVTLFFLLISSFYANKIKPEYESSATIEVGNFNGNIEWIDLDKYRFLNSEILAQTIGKNGILIRMKGFNSKEISESSIKLEVDKIITSTNNQIKNKIENNILANSKDLKIELNAKMIDLDLINNRLINRDAEIERLKSFEKLKLDSLDRKIDSLDRKINDINIEIEKLLAIDNTQSTENMIDIQISNYTIGKSILINEKNILINELMTPAGNVKLSDSNLSRENLITEKKFLLQNISNLEAKLLEITNLPIQKNISGYSFSKILKDVSSVQLNPKRPLMVILFGTLFGLFISIFISYTREILKD